MCSCGKPHKPVNFLFCQVVVWLQLFWSRLAGFFSPILNLWLSSPQMTTLLHSKWGLSEKWSESEKFLILNKKRFIWWLVKWKLESQRMRARKKNQKIQAFEQSSTLNDNVKFFDKFWCCELFFLNCPHKMFVPLWCYEWIQLRINGFVTNIKSYERTLYYQFHDAQYTTWSVLLWLLIS